MPTSSSFHWQDPFDLESQLSDSERQVRDSAREFCARELQPGVVTANREAKFDIGLVKKFGEVGMFGATLPEKYGGAGLNYVCYGLLAREVERVDSGYRSCMSVQSSLVMQPIFEFGSERQKEEYLPKLARGELIGCFGLTEAEHGSDPSGMQTRAVEVSDGYILSGSKTWITNAPIADIAIVWAKLDDGKIAGFIVPRAKKVKTGDADADGGFTSNAIEGKLSLRASPTGEVVLGRVFVPKANRLPLAKGMRAPFACLNRARYGIAWGVMGAAEGCWWAAREYTMQRKQFGKPLAQTQLVQKKLADMQGEIALGLQACLRAGRLFDEERCSPQVISLIKRNNCGKALQIARVARDMHGANGISDEFHVMRHLVNLETVNTYEGTHDIHALILGRGQTGLEAF